MNTEDLLRAGLRDLADQAPPAGDLTASAITRGRRRRAVRRAATTGGVAVCVAAISGVGVVVAHGNDGNRQRIVSRGPAPQQVVADPWWDTWTPGRHDGPVNQAFIDSLDPKPGVQGEGVTVYAAGTTADGTEWAMYTDPHLSHQVSWMDGRDGHGSYGDTAGEADASMTWTSMSFPTESAAEGTSGNQQWLIVVGQPGTTEVDYSPDGSTWQPLETHDGIAMKFFPEGFPPASARVRLMNQAGVYAEGAPVGAGAGVSPSPSPGSGSATPTPTPYSTTATASPAPTGPSS